MRVNKRQRKLMKQRERNSRRASLGLIGRYHHNQHYNYHNLRVKYGLGIR